MTAENTEPQGKTTNPMDNQQESKEKILRVMTGALSVLSFGRELSRLSLPAHVLPPSISLRSSDVMTTVFEPWSGLEYSCLYFWMVTTIVLLNSDFA